MSEPNPSDRLHGDLAALAERARTRGAGMPSASAIVGRGRQRRRRRAIAAVAVPVVAIVAAVSGALAAADGGQGQHVSVANPEHPTHQAGPGLITVPPARMVHADGAGNLGHCAVVSDPAASNGPLAADLGPLRADPVTVSAVWIPDLLVGSGCRSQVTTGSAATASRLAAALLGAHPATGTFSCPIMLGSRVELVFQYAATPRLALVRLQIGGCATATLPGGQIRLAGAAANLLPLLHPPTWAHAGLPVGGSRSLGASTATP